MKHFYGPQYFLSNPWIWCLCQLFSCCGELPDIFQSGLLNSHVLNDCISNHWSLTATNQETQETWGGEANDDLRWTEQNKNRKDVCITTYSIFVWLTLSNLRLKLISVLDLLKSCIILLCDWMAEPADQLIIHDAEKCRFAKTAILLLIV